MKSKGQFLRYKIIDQALHKKSWVKTSQLKRAIESVTLESITERTIQKDIKAMQFNLSLGYAAPIEYGSKKRAYRYTDPEYSIMKFSLKENEISALKFYTSCLNIYGAYGIFKDFSSAIQKILDGINIKSKFGEKVDNILIQTDTATTIVGAEYLEDIIQAIDEKLKVEFDYIKFGETKPKKRLLHPYLLKEYKNRWYVIGYLEGKSNVTTFGLDRIAHLKIVNESFEKEVGFEHDKYFNNSFGITRPDSPAMEIILEFSSKQAPYIKSLPIHSTQKVIKETKNYIRISIKVIPCYELYEYILSKTPDVKIISPQAVVNHIQEALKAALKKYSQK